MSKTTTKEEENQNKGGRYPKFNAEYFTMKGNRPDELAIIKMQFGSEGVDFYVSVFETLCESDYFIYPFQNKHYLALLAKKKEIDKERFLEILKFCVEELGLFNQELYDKGYIFSEAFLNSFDSAGLFRNRTMTADDVREKVKEYLNDGKAQSTMINHPKTELNQNPASVEDSIVKNTITNNSEEREKEKIEKERISKVEEDSKETKESLKLQGEPDKNSSLASDEGDEPF